MGSAEVINTLVSRSLEENLAFIQQDPDHEYLYHVKIGFIPNMKVIKAGDLGIFMSFRYRVEFS